MTEALIQRITRSEKMSKAKNKNRMLTKRFLDVKQLNQINHRAAAALEELDELDNRYYGNS